MNSLHRLPKEGVFMDQTGARANRLWPARGTRRMIENIRRTGAGKFGGRGQQISFPLNSQSSTQFA
jgi:hypothetical protein